MLGKTELRNYGSEFAREEKGELNRIELVTTTDPIIHDMVLRLLRVCLYYMRNLELRQERHNDGYGDVR